MATTRKRPAVAVAATVPLVLGLCAGSAYALWRTSGSGSGTATVGTVRSVTVQAATAAPSTALTPNSTGDLVLTLDNPNAYSVTITGVTQNGTVAASGGIGACTTTGVSVPAAVNSGLSVTLASGTGVTVHIAGGAAMSSASDTGCQGATFQIPVTMTVQR